MNASETGKLLAFAALYDNRKVSDPDVVAWLKAIGDLPYADAETAVAAHYGQSTERIMPGHVRQLVKAARRDRIERDPAFAAVPHELADQPGKYRQALQAGIKKLADGFTVRRAIGCLPGEDPPPLAEIRSQLRRALPPAERLLPPEEIARRQVIAARAARGADAQPDAGEPAA